jgi:hypothetical protein
MPDAQRSECVALRFGRVVAGSGMSCDLFVEIVNQNRDDGAGGEIAVAPLTVERAEILVRNQDGRVPDPPIVMGPEAGFELLTEAGDPLTFPFEVPVAPGASRGSRVLRVRFDGQAGSWIGSQTDDLGLRIFTDDPENPIETILVTASGSSPEIEVVPSLVDFGPVEQGQTRTATLSVRNLGNAELTIAGAMLRSPNPELTFAAADGMPIARTLAAFTGSFDVLVSYTPGDPANDRAFWEISSDDPDEMTFPVEIRGGPTPAFCFEPRSGILEFPITDETSPGPRAQDVSLQSCGTGNLTITGLDIQNSGNPASLDDFRIDYDGCRGTLPCSPNIELCPQNEPGCTIGGMMPGILETVPIVYENNDTSTQDLADLVVTTDDPTLPEVRITLSATDNPCLPPSANVEVVGPARPCVPQPVQLRVVGSPGGPVGGNATFSQCDWNMDFAQASPNTFTPDASAEACMMTQFIPVAPGGLHLVSVTVRNSCGAEASTPSEQITVAPECN